jgi:hypothetical protein
MNPLWLLLFVPKKGQEAPSLPAPSRLPTLPRGQATATKRDLAKAAKTPPPWPAKEPSNLPPFPEGWEPDSPPSKDAISRAAQLISTLHGRGLGSYVTEFLGGRWLTFVAKMHGKKKAVEAWRPKSRAARRPVVRPSVPVSTKAAWPAGGTASAPTSTAPVSSPVRPAPSVSLPPTVKRGDGMGARESLSETVKQAQTALNGHGASLKVDGDFGPLTEAATREFQAAYKLQVDGIIGPKTWTALLGG